MAAWFNPETRPTGDRVPDFQADVSFLYRKDRIELRAKTIRDPIRRLRYLRTQVGDGGWLLVEPRRRLRWGVLQRPKLFASLALLVLCMLTLSGYTASWVQPAPSLGVVILPPPVPAPPLNVGNLIGVWMVDQKQDVETFSNGLRVENRYVTANRPRRPYAVFPRYHADSAHVEWKDKPAGIVFHTTESLLAPFEEDQNRNLQRISESVLNFVRRNRSYHFFIDRFGRVFRVVQESDTANHAGNSVWGDEQYVYVNLNSSFLGVAFETQTNRGETLPSANDAQVHAGRVLTEMLRAKYGIPATNCVTHAQVSVNPANMLIGYHTDWAGNFPFQAIGLHDNYSVAPASLYAFGFDYDPVFVHSTGDRLLQGLLVAEGQVRSRAAERKLTLSQYRTILQKNYKEVIAAAKARGDVQENANEQR